MAILPTLLLVDLQHDYLRSPALEPHRELITGAAARLLDAARLNRIPVVHVWTTVRTDRDERMPHWKAAGTWQCVEGTGGHRTPDQLTPVPGESIVHKTFFSAFSSVESMDDMLARTKADVLVLAGIHLHACVRATGLDAYQRGFDVWIAEDATGSDDPVHAAITRRYLEDRSFHFASVETLSRCFSSGESPAVLNRRQPGPVGADADKSPARGRAVPVGDASDVAMAVKNARNAASAIRSLSANECASAMHRLIVLLAEATESLVDCVVAETGKPVKHARRELAGSIRMLEMTAARIPGEQRNLGADPRVRYRPLGNIAVISSWNNPVYIPLGKIVPALRYDNTVVWKPAEEATRTADMVHELLLEVFPRGAVQLLAGDGSTGSLLVRSPGVDGVSFTGSLGTGRLIQEACARRFVPLQAELGGNNAAIVMDDCDTALAARLIVHGAFAQAGQRCTATRRAVVMRSILPQFIDALKSACSSMVWGDPRDEATDIGPLISLEQKSRVEQAVERAGSGGSHLEHLHTSSMSGNRAPGDLFLSPVLVVCEDPGMDIVQEELFGPVLVVQPADTFEHAIRLCNGVRQGLAASVFSASAEHVSRFLELAEAGILKINQATDGAEPDVPFGGWKASGAGPAEHGVSDREFYTRVQAVYADSGGVH